MARNTLATKYRPSTFEDVVEQNIVVDILKNICSTDELDCRNFLLIGSAGTGKTTLARICSNVLNQGEGDVIELDAASYGGVDSIREIVQQAKQYPVGCKYKVFIIDECHSLSNTAWQAMLKVLEDNPAKSVFFLCTTNPEKIPATILSRVQTFQLSKISLDGIINRLIFVLESEVRDGRTITYTKSAVTYIAKLANGGMRDALTLLDKALAYSNCIDVESISKSLDLPDYDDYFKLLNAYAKKDNESIVKLIDKVYNSGTNFVRWFERFHSFVMNVVKYIFMKDINATMIPLQYEDKLSKYGSSHAVVCLRLADILLKMNYELKTTQYLQEVTLTHLCSISKKG